MARRKKRARKGILEQFLRVIHLGLLLFGGYTLICKTLALPKIHSWIAYLAWKGFWSQFFN